MLRIFSKMTLWFEMFSTTTMPKTGDPELQIPERLMRSAVQHKKSQRRVELRLLMLALS
jgi:hypothetical protein